MLSEDQLQKLITNAYGWAENLLVAVLILIIGFWLAGRVRRSVSSLIAKRSGDDQTLSLFAASLAKYAVVVVTWVIVLAEFGVETTSLIAVLGAMGLAIGLALQGTLSNVAAGVMLLVLRPFKVGDFIEAGALAGTVQEIGIFQTELKDPNGVCMMAPNAMLWTSSIINYSRNATRRVDLLASIAYGDDHLAAMALLKNMIAADERILDDPAPVVFVAALGESSVDISVRGWTNTADYWQTTWDLKADMKKRLEAAGYSIPFPQRDLHIISGEPLPLSGDKMEKS